MWELCKETALQHLRSVWGWLHVPVTQKLGQPVATKEGSISSYAFQEAMGTSLATRLPRGGFMGGDLLKDLVGAFFR